MHSRRYPKLFGTKINSFTHWNVLVRYHCEFGSVVFRKLLVICEKAKAIAKFKHIFEMEIVVRSRIQERKCGKENI